MTIRVMCRVLYHLVSIQIQNHAQDLCVRLDGPHAPIGVGYTWRSMRSRCLIHIKEPKAQRCFLIGPRIVS